MKLFLPIICISLILLMTVLLKPYKETMDLPVLQDFNHHQSKTFKGGKVLSLKINSCLSVVTINFHDSDDVNLEYADKDQLSINYLDHSLTIYNINQGITFCHKKSDIHSIINITIPNDLITLDIDITAYLTTFNGTRLNARSFNYKSNDSQFNLSNSTFNSLNIDLFKGNILLNQIDSEKVSIYNTTGSVYLENSRINDIIEIKLSKGDIVLNNVKTSIVNTKFSLGHTFIKQLNAISKITIINENGQLNLENTYCKIIFLTLNTGDIIFYNEDLLFYIDLLEFSLYSGSTQFNLNGNIIKV